MHSNIFNFTILSKEMRNNDTIPSAPPYHTHYTLYTGGIRVARSHACICHTQPNIRSRISAHFYVFFLSSAAERASTTMSNREHTCKPFRLSRPTKCRNFAFAHSVLRRARLENHHTHTTFSHGCALISAPQWIRIKLSFCAVCDERIHTHTHNAHAQTLNHIFWTV